uniref:Uncharacterized protein n=1 Tax=Setaria italica TaxID=4555 RepID=K3XH40_SETIT
MIISTISIRPPKDFPCRSRSFTLGWAGVRGTSPLARQVGGFRARHENSRAGCLHRSRRRPPAETRSPAPGAGRWQVAHGAGRRAPPPPHEQVMTLARGRISGGRNGPSHRVPAAGAGGGREEGEGEENPPAASQFHLDPHARSKSPSPRRVGLTGWSGPIGPTRYVGCRCGSWTVDPHPHPHRSTALVGASRRSGRVGVGWRVRAAKGPAKQLPPRHRNPDLGFESEREKDGEKAMAEPEALEMRGLGLEGLMAPSPDFRSARIITIPKIKDDSAVEAAANKAAAGSGMVKAASWSDFVTKPAGNKAASASSIEPAAKVEGKAKQAAASSIEPVAKAEGKAKQAAASSIEPVAKAEGKAKQAAASSIEPVAKAEGKPKAKLLLRRAWELDAKPEPAVISVGTERLGEDEIEYVRTHRMRRLTPPDDLIREFFPRIAACFPKAAAIVNKTVDLQEDILRQYETKGYALVRVERLDNGLKRWFRLPEAETA